jgi:hypothetical protein
MKNNPVLIYSSFSQACDLVLNELENKQLNFDYICADSKVVRKHLEAWDISKVPTIIDTQRDYQPPPLYIGKQMCLDYIDTYFTLFQPPPQLPPQLPPQPPPQPQPQPQPQPPPQPQPQPQPQSQPQHQPQPEPESVKVVQKRTAINYEEDSSDEKSLDPHEIQREKVRKFQEDKQRKAEKIQREAENKQSTNEKNDIVSAALRMRRAREALDSERSRKDKKDTLMQSAN